MVNVYKPLLRARASILKAGEGLKVLWVERVSTSGGDLKGKRGENTGFAFFTVMLP